MKRKALGLEAVLERRIAYRPIFFQITGNINATLFLSQCWWWSTSNPKTDGWFYQTQSQWRDATGMTKRQQEAARKILRGFAYIQERRGKPKGKLYFRIDSFVINMAIKDFLEHSPRVARRVFGDGIDWGFDNVFDIADKRPKVFRVKRGQFVPRQGPKRTN